MKGIFNNKIFLLISNLFRFLFFKLYKAIIFQNILQFKNIIESNYQVFHSFFFYSRIKGKEKNYNFSCINFENFVFNETLKVQSCYGKNIEDLKAQLQKVTITKSKIEYLYKLNFKTQIFTIIVVVYFW